MIERLIAALLLICISPVLLFTYVVVSFTSKGPFIFRQKRMGKDGKVFTIYKIRSMNVMAEEEKGKYMHLNEADGPVFKIYDDPRYTSIGRVLAHTGFDEILQLINICKGEMSFVGPRPLPVAEASKVPQRYKARFSVLPGITSLWVINGAHNQSFREWMESDISYIKKKNPMTDIYILFVTVLLSIKWNVDMYFMVVFPFILLFYAITPNSYWWTQIFIAATCAIFLGLDMGRPIPKLLLSAIFALLVSAFYSINTINSVPYFFVYLTTFLLSVSISREKIKFVIHSFIIGTLLIGAISSLYTAVKIIFNAPPPFLRFLDANYNMVIPQFGHAFYGIFIILTLPFIMEKISNTSSSKLWKIIFCLFFLFLLFTFSKSTIILALSEIIIYLGYTHYKSKRNFGKIPLILGFILTSFVVFIIISFYRNGWVQGKIIKQSLAPRVEYWQQGIRIIQTSDLTRLMLGFGPSSFFELSNKYESRPGYWARATDHILLQSVIENGLVATLIVAFFICFIFLKRFTTYSLSEKLALTFVILYSFGSSYDLVNVFPAMFLFFLILQKYEKEDRLQSRFSFKPIILSLCIVVWLIYLGVYTYVMVGGNHPTGALKLFPYESAFWEVTIDNSHDRKSLIALTQLMEKYATVNIELEKLIISNLYSGKSYCDVIDTSLSYLQHAPYEISVQDMMMASLENCPSTDKNEVLYLLQSIKAYFAIADENLYPLYNFLRFAADFTVANKQFDDSLFWYEKSWRANPWSQKSFEGIEFVDKIQLLDRASSISFLQKYLEAKDQTNYKSFDKVRKETAREWELLSDWYRGENQISEASNSITKSITVYPYYGDLYFKAAQLFLLSGKKETIDSIRNLCSTNFQNASWCEDIL